MNVSDYVARISNASPVGLVSITCELMLAHVNNALSAREDKREYTRHAELSSELLCTLIDALNMDYELSRTLFPLYIYVNKLLINAKITGQAELLTDVLRIMTPLYEGWKELADKESKESGEAADAAESAMKTSQTIFAGLTYGRGELTEYIEEDSDKSYRA